MKDSSITIKISESQKAELKKQADKERRTLSDYIRLALEEKLLNERSK